MIGMYYTGIIEIISETIGMKKKKSIKFYFSNWVIKIIIKLLCHCFVTNV